MTGDSEKFAGIRLVGFDVDGVFTDGRFYLADDGTEMKAFHTQDGFGIRRLRDAGIHVCIISGRRSNAVARRMQELGVAHVILGTRDKVAALHELIATIDVAKEETAYVGDDVPDLPLLAEVGLPIAVANAMPEVKAACAYTTTRPGGFGAVREVCDLVFEAGRS